MQDYRDPNETVKFKVSAFCDESENTFSLGTFTWDEIMQKHDAWLRKFHSIRYNGIRYYPRTGVGDAQQDRVDADTNDV